MSSEKAEMPDVKNETNVPQQSRGRRSSFTITNIYEVDTKQTSEILHGDEIPQALRHLQWWDSPPDQEDVSSSKGTTVEKDVYDIENKVGSGDHEEGSDSKWIVTEHECQSSGWDEESEVIDRRRPGYPDFNQLLDSFKGIEDKKITDINSLLPQNAYGSYTHSVDAHIEHGFYYRWYDSEDCVWVLRFHSLNKYADPKFRSSKYWNLRIETGGHYMDNKGNLYSADEANPWGGNPKEDVIENTHICIEIPTPEQINQVKRALEERNGQMRDLGFL